MSQEADLCDCCDQPVEKGFTFMGEVHGPRGGTLNICDSCLNKAKQSKIGFVDNGEVL
jgi:hypothetical protein